MKFRIWANKQYFANIANATDYHPVWAVADEDGNVSFCPNLKIIGTTELVCPGTRLASGARAWVETYDMVLNPSMLDHDAVQVCIKQNLIKPAQLRVGPIDDA